MTLAQAKNLASDLLGSNVGVTVVVGTSQSSSDWKVIAVPQVGVTVDAQQVASLETKYGVLAPVSGQIVFA